MRTVRHEASSGAGKRSTLETTGSRFTTRSSSRDRFSDARTPRITRPVSQTGRPKPNTLSMETPRYENAETTSMRLPGTSSMRMAKIQVRSSAIEILLQEPRDGRGGAPQGLQLIVFQVELHDFLDPAKGKDEGNA